MKLQSIEITNFRGIEKLDLDLDPRLTVLVGENGAGKTTILDALEALLRPYVERLTSPLQPKVYWLVPQSLKIGAVENELSLTAVDDNTAELIKWTTVGQSQPEQVRQRKMSDHTALYTLFHKIANRQTSGDDYLRGETAVIYYDQSRGLLDPILQSDSYQGIHPREPNGTAHEHNRNEVGHTPASAFAEGLEHRGIDFGELTTWFAERESEELRHQKRDASYRDLQLEAVRNAITGATDFSDLEFTWDHPKGLKLKKQGVELHANQLSTGERGFLALAGDLARRLAIMNKAMANPLMGSAIVLIDEVELHLHPRWQRKILPWLLETFPSCQFIVTTHSPQVLGEIQAQHIRILKPDDRGRIEVSVPRASFGRDSNFLLLSILGSDERDSDSKQHLSQIDDAIAAGKFDEAQQGIKALREKIEGTAPEVTIAEARLARRQRSPSG